MTQATCLRRYRQDAQPDLQRAAVAGGPTRCRRCRCCCACCPVAADHRKWCSFCIRALTACLPQETLLLFGLPCQQIELSTSTRLSQFFNGHPSDAKQFPFATLGKMSRRRV